MPVNNSSPVVFLESFNGSDALPLDFNQSASLFFTVGKEDTLFKDVPSLPLFLIIHGTASLFFLFTFFVINYL